MVIVDCPHCGDETDLGEGSPGMYTCPHCYNDFEFGDDPATEQRELVQMGLFLAVFFFFVGMFLLILFGEASICFGGPGCEGGGP